MPVRPQEWPCVDNLSTTWIGHNVQEGLNPAFSSSGIIHIWIRVKRTLWNSHVITVIIQRFKLGDATAQRASCAAPVSLVQLQQHLCCVLLLDSECLSKLIPLHYTEMCTGLNSKDDLMVRDRCVRVSSVLRLIKYKCLFFKHFILSYVLNIFLTSADLRI